VVIIECDIALTPPLVRIAGWRINPTSLQQKDGADNQAKIGERGNNASRCGGFGRSSEEGCVRSAQSNANRAAMLGIIIASPR